MTKATTISIVIPVYNQAEYLPSAIESALEQTVPCEIIVVNDGSTDGSLEIAKRFPVKVVNQINKGLSSARNTGIMNATGDYVLFLDADDMLLDACVERIISTIKSTNADIVAPSFKCFGMDNSEIRLMERPGIEDFKMGNRIGYCCAIRREVLLEVGGYSPRMTWGYEDYALTFNLLRLGKTLETIPERLWLYRTKEQSMITEAVKHHDELMEQIRKDNHEIF